MTLAIIIFIVFCIAILSVVLMKTLGSPKDEDLTHTDYKEYAIQQIDLDMFAILNEYRIENNSPILVMIPTLCNIAYSNSERLADLNYTKKQMEVYGHSGFYERSQNYPDRSFSENVGYGFQSAKGFMDAFKKSAAHSRNMLDRNKVYVGIATAKGANGRLYTTFNFLK